MIDPREFRLRLALWFHQSWSFKLIARARKCYVPKSHSFNNFEPLTLEQQIAIAEHAPKIRGIVIDNLSRADWRWLVKSLLRYQRSGTGPVAGTLSGDPTLLDIERAFIGRLTNCLLSNWGRK